MRNKLRPLFSILVSLSLASCASAIGEGREIGGFALDRFRGDLQTRSEFHDRMNDARAEECRMRDDVANMAKLECMQSGATVLCLDAAADRYQAAATCWETNKPDILGTADDVIKAYQDVKETIRKQ